MMGNGGVAVANMENRRCRYRYRYGYVEARGPAEDGHPRLQAGPLGTDAQQGGHLLIMSIGGTKAC